MIARSGRDGNHPVTGFVYGAGGSWLGSSFHPADRRSRMKVAWCSTPRFVRRGLGHLGVLSGPARWRRSAVTSVGPGYSGGRDGARSWLASRLPPASNGSDTVHRDLKQDVMTTPRREGLLPTRRRYTYSYVVRTRRRGKRRSSTACWISIRPQPYHTRVSGLPMPSSCGWRDSRSDGSSTRTCMPTTLSAAAYLQSPLNVLPSIRARVSRGAGGDLRAPVQRGRHIPARR